MKRCLTFMLFVGTAMSLFGQVTTNGGSGLAATYTDLAAAITALNTVGTATSPTTITLLTGNPQTAPAGGYTITATGTAANPITIIGAGAGSTVTASAAQVSGSLHDAIFEIVGGDYITIDGFKMQENAANTTIAVATNNMTEWGVALLYASLTNGAQNNTIQNNTISLNRTYLNTFGIYSNTRHAATTVANGTTVTAEVTSASGSNSFNKVYGNAISNVNYGIVFIGAGTTIAAIDNGNDIGGTSSATGNVITNWGLGASTASTYTSLTGNNYCIFDNQQINENISYNTITSAAVTSVVTEGGILKNYSVASPTSGTITMTMNNNTVTVTNAPTSTTGPVIGINSQGLTPLLSTATFSMNNNTVQNCVLSGSTVTTSGITAITNLSLPGTLNMTGNTVLNNAITGSASTSGTIAGITNSGAAGTVNITNNVIRGMASTATSGQIIGISSTGAVVTALNIDNNQLGNATSGFFTTSTATSGGLFGINVTTAATTCALSIQTNDIRGITYSTAASASQTYIVNTAVTLSQNISSNTFTNLTVNTTGSVTFISNSVTVSATGTQTISSNSIVTAFSKTGAGGTITLATSTQSSTAGAVINHNNNNFSNITVTGATTIAGWVSQDGGTANKTYSGNTFSNWTGGTSAITCMNIDYGGGGGGNGNVISNNTISNITGSGNVTGLVVGGNATLQTVFGNTISGLSSTGTAGVVTGLNLVAGSSGLTINAYKNKIYNLSTSNTAATAGVVSGILISGSATTTTTNTYNNVVGDLRATASISTDAIRGISVTATGLTSTHRVYNNSVYLNATGGATFGTSGVYHAASATATTATLDLRNNLIVNLSTPAGAGVTTAFRRSAAATLGNYASTSDRNAFVATSIMNDGTTNYTDLATYKTAVSARDVNSFTTEGGFTYSTAGSFFTSLTGSSTDFLKPVAGITTLVESGSSVISTPSITDDYAGVTRSATPDIGAFEFAGVSLYITYVFNATTDNNWSTASNWSSNLVPTCSSDASIAASKTCNIDITGAVAKSLTNLGTLVVGTGTDLTIANCSSTLNTSTFLNNGTLTVTGGNLNVNGNMVIANASNFSQSGGTIKIDGNGAGVAANSVASGTHLFSIGTSSTNYATGTVDLTGGTLLIVDPHASTNTSSWAFAYFGATSSNNITPGAGFTLQFGDGVSTDAGGNASGGFVINQWEINGGFKPNFVVNTGSGTNRFVTSNYTPFVVQNLTVQSGDFRAATSTTVEGNLTVNTPGIYTASTTLTMAIGTFVNTSVATSASTTAQTIGGTGTLRNSTSSPTANLVGLVINNSNATGITTSIPLTMSGILNLTLGKLSIGANDLTLITGGSITGGSATACVVTNGTGKLKQAITAGGTRIFPIGGSTSTYSPLSATPTSATTFGASVANAINPSHTLSPAALAVSGSREWDLSSTVASSTTLAFTPNDGRTDPTGAVKIGHWNGTSWDADIAATFSGSGATGTFTGIGTTFSPYIVTEASVALAVEFTHIAAKTNGATNLVTFTTANESNLKSFNIEKSATGTEGWSTIGTMKPKGASNYVLTDNQPLPISYYRVRSIDLDGKESVSKIVSVSASKSKLAILSLYPNPTKGTTTIDFEAAANGLATIALKDLTGKVVLSKNSVITEGVNQINLDMSALSNGIYMLIINDKTASVAKRIVKQ
ncbi:MAG: T9SS type A sorting domain-containing protein [Saprospiraceae bacterium]|nr:T9SS type A sorting domain-containing protein [Saprospiraceae bacterium]